MESKTKTTTVFISEDGKEFLTEQECKKYEQETLSILKKIKFFSAYHSPDLTEGRGFYGKTYFAVYDEGYCAKHRCLAYLMDKYGRPVDYVQGCSAIENYGFPVEITKEEYLKPNDSRVGSYSYKPTMVFISQKQVEGFPEPIWIK